MSDFQGGADAPPPWLRQGGIYFSRGGCEVPWLDARAAYTRAVVYDDTHELIPWLTFLDWEYDQVRVESDIAIKFY